MSEIQELMLTKPLETSVSEYQDLIHGGEAWYALLRLFKMKRFPLGLAIIIPTTEERTNQQTPTASPTQPVSSAQFTSSPYAPSQSGSFAIGGAALHCDGALSHDPDACGSGEGRFGEGDKVAVDTSLDRTSPANVQDDNVSLDDQGDKDHSPVEKTLPRLAKSVASRRKRKRAPEHEESAEEDGGYQPSARELRALRDGVPSGEPAEFGHRGLNASMKRLEDKARNLEREQARAMSELIEALLEVPPSQVFMNVAQRLKQEIPVGEYGKYKRTAG